MLSLVIFKIGRMQGIFPRKDLCGANAASYWQYSRVHKDGSNQHLLIGSKYATYNSRLLKAICGGHSCLLLREILSGLAFVTQRSCQFRWLTMPDRESSGATCYSSISWNNGLKVHANGCRFETNVQCTTLIEERAAVFNMMSIITVRS